MDKVLMQPPGGAPQWVSSAPEDLIPLMVQGWTQVKGAPTTAPPAETEVTEQ